MAVAFRWVLLGAHEDLAMLFALVNDTTYSKTNPDKTAIRSYATRPPT